MSTKISWTDETWNVVTGCSKVSAGCAHCYIERTPPMRMAGRRFVDGKIPVTLHPDRLEIPLHWRKPRMVFVPSMGDPFHEDVPDEFIDKVFAVMALAQRHTFQVLTKRPVRMQDFIRSWLMGLRDHTFKKVLPNVWLMVSAENQKAADERVPILMETPAAVRGVSLEPLLGPLDLTPWLGSRLSIKTEGNEGALVSGTANVGLRGLDWVIVGGESGGPENRRLVERCECRIPYVAKTGVKMQRHPRWWACEVCGGTGYRPKPEALAWVRSIREQCAAAGVPFWWKQWGPRAGQGTLLDGREHKEMPA